MWQQRQTSAMDFLHQSFVESAMDFLDQPFVPVESSSLLANKDFLPADVNDVWGVSDGLSESESSTATET